MDSLLLDEEETEVIPPELRGPELLQACRDDNTALATELIGLGVPTTAVVDKGWTALHFAALNGNEELMSLLLNAGAQEPYKMAKLKAAVQKTDDITVSNTPLQWAAYHGHVNICWVLLDAGYDPDDPDSIGNTSLHMAASNNHEAIVRILVKSGADLTITNMFSHTPLDLATSPACRDLLRRPLVNNLTSSVKEGMLQDNLNTFKAAQYQIETLLKADGTLEDINRMDNAIAEGEEIKVSSKLLQQARKLLKKWEMEQALVSQIAVVEQAEPITSQQQYCDLVNRLLVVGYQAKEHGVEGPILDKMQAVVDKSESEFWLNRAAKKLLGVDCATTKHFKDMAHLEEQIKKAREVHAQEELITTSDVLLARLNCEVGLTKALTGFPEVRLPLPEMPKDYWQPEDLGHVQETEGYPLPPEDGQYKWIHSDAYIRFKKAHAQLKYAIEEAEKYGANAQVVADAKVKDKQADGTAKVLEQKDEADKALAIAAVEKLAKKLKKSNKKKK